MPCPACFWYFKCSVGEEIATDALWSVIEQFSGGSMCDESRHVSSLCSRKWEGWGRQRTCKTRPGGHILRVRGDRLVREQQKTDVSVANTKTCPDEHVFRVWGNGQGGGGWIGLVEAARRRKNTLSTSCFEQGRGNHILIIIKVNNKRNRGHTYLVCLTYCTCPAALHCRFALSLHFLGVVSYQLCSWSPSGILASVDGGDATDTSGLPISIGHLYLFIIGN